MVGTGLRFASAAPSVPSSLALPSAGWGGCGDGLALLVVVGTGLRFASAAPSVGLRSTARFDREVPHRLSGGDGDVGVSGEQLEDERLVGRVLGEIEPDQSDRPLPRVQVGVALDGEALRDPLG